VIGQAARRGQRSEAEVRSQQVARQLVTKLLERSAVNQVLHPPLSDPTPATPPTGRGSGSGGSGQSTPGSRGSRGRGIKSGAQGGVRDGGGPPPPAVQRDMFELDPLPSTGLGADGSIAANSELVLLRVALIIFRIGVFYSTLTLSDSFDIAFDSLAS